MSTYDEIDLDDMIFDSKQEIFTSPCPCGDNFFISVESLFDNEDKAKCPSCSLILKVRFDPETLEERFDSEETQEEQVQEPLAIIAN